MGTLTLDQVNRLRNGLGKCGALCCIVFLLAVVDGLVVGFREPANLFRLLGGESVAVNGYLKEDVTDLAQLTYKSPSDGIGVTFEVIHSGFWLGGKMWRGLLTVSPEQEKGEYLVAVHPRNDPSPKASTLLLVRVYPDAESMRRDAKSFIQRTLNVSPWLVFTCFFPLALLSFFLVFLLSQRRERLMREIGMADIYYVARGASAWEISFSLGTQHGVEPGSRLNVLDKDGLRVGEAVVIESTTTDSTATVDLQCPVTPRHMVSRLY